MYEHENLMFRWITVKKFGGGTANAAEHSRLIENEESRNGFTKPIQDHNTRIDVCEWQKKLSIISRNE